MQLQGCCATYSNCNCCDSFDVLIHFNLCRVNGRLKAFAMEMKSSVECSVSAKSSLTGLCSVVA